MASIVKIKITNSGADPGPYNIFFIDSGNNSTAGPTGITKQVLTSTAGYTLTVPTSAVKVRIQSVNQGCSTYHLDLNIP
jgi:ABC-type proline/glycine betaine transport system substrate-binding protein